MDPMTAGVMIAVCCVAAIAIIVVLALVVRKSSGRASQDHAAAVAPGRQEWANRNGWQYDPTTHQVPTDEINTLHGWTRPVQLSHTVTGTVDDRRIQVFTRMSLRPRTGLAATPGRPAPESLASMSFRITRFSTNNEPWMQQTGDREVFAVTLRQPAPQVVDGRVTGMPPEQARMLDDRLRAELSGIPADPNLFCDGSTVRLYVYGGFAPEDQDRHLGTALRVTQLLEHSR